MRKEWQTVAHVANRSRKMRVETWSLGLFIWKWAERLRWWPDGNRFKRKWDRTKEFEKRIVAGRETEIKWRPLFLESGKMNWMRRWSMTTEAWLTSLSWGPWAQTCSKICKWTACPSFCLVPVHSRWKGKFNCSCYFAKEAQVRERQGFEGIGNRVIAFVDHEI